MTFIDRYVEKRRLEQERRDSDTQLKEQICESKQRIYIIENKFEYAVDKDLVESAIYELLAEQKRFQYLVKQAKIRGLQFIA